MKIDMVTKFAVKIPELNYRKLQDDSEIQCTEKFLAVYNKVNLTYFENPKKNPTQNEVDVFCEDKNSGKILSIQVKKADFKVASILGNHKKVPISGKPLLIRDNSILKDRILNNILEVENKYFKQGKNMSSIILLLDETMNPSNGVIEPIKKEIKKSIFKEIWLVKFNGGTYRLY